MTESSFLYAIAIDTSVFEHMFNPQENKENHINVLLQHLQEDGVKLLMDKELRVYREYLDRIGHRLGIVSERSNETQLLRYWMSPDSKKEIVTVDWSDDLMNVITDVMTRNTSGADKILVYISFSRGKNLVSNDRQDIVCNRDKLKRRAKNICPASRTSKILESREAFELIDTSD